MAPTPMPTTDHDDERKRTAAPGGAKDGEGSDMELEGGEGGQEEDTGFIRFYDSEDEDGASVG